MNVEISIIIPFFNAEKYIKRCLVSVMNQTFSDFEVIMIDDGSTDQSYNIARCFEVKYENINIYRQKNLGVAQARNLGLKKVTGNYIAFVDSDDYLDKEYLHKLYYAALKYKSEITCCNFYWHFQEKNINIKNYIYYRHGVFNHFDAIGYLIKDTTIQSYLWNKLWKKELFYNISFPDMYFEDIAVCIKLFYNAKQVYIINDVLYYYNQHKQSILHSYTFETQNDYLKSFMIIRNFLDEKNLYPYYKKAYGFLYLKVKTVMISSLFLIHLHNRSFQNLIGNYKRAFRFMKKCKKEVTDSILINYTKIQLFNEGNSENE